MNLEEIRTRLNDRRQVLMDRLSQMHTSIHHREEPLPADFAEQAVELESRETMEALDDESKHELRQIDRALRRLEEGQYGTCEHCGQDIAAKRLDVLPFATLCIRCANESEKR